VSEVLNNASNRAQKLTEVREEFELESFTTQSPPPRFISIDTDEFGTAEEIHQADSLSVIASHFDGSQISSAATWIVDLDTGEVLRPDFGRPYRVLHMYRGGVIV
jgi:hypothetical protein